MNWGVEDLSAAVALLAGMVGGVIVALRTKGSRAVRLSGAGMVILVTTLIWAHLAVIIF